MSHKKKGNGKHLTFSDRVYISQELVKYSSFRNIAENMSKDPSTISKVIQLHSIGSLFRREIPIIRKEPDILFIYFSGQEFIMRNLMDLAECHDPICGGIRLFCFPVADCTPSDIRSVGELSWRHVPFTQECIYILSLIVPPSLSIFAYLL